MNWQPIPTDKSGLVSRYVMVKDSHGNISVAVFQIGYWWAELTTFDKRNVTEWRELTTHEMARFKPVHDDKIQKELFENAA